MADSRHLEGRKVFNVNALEIPPLHPVTMPEVNFTIPGTPKAQPRVKGRIAGKGPKSFVQVYTPDTADDWKRTVATFTRIKMKVTPGPIDLMLSFRIQRPKAHFGTGKNAQKLREAAPFYHAQKPDVDNLAKAVIDAMVDSGRIDDDSNVISLVVIKNWVESDPGCLVTVKPRA